MPGAFRYSYGLPVRLGVLRRLCRDPLGIRVACRFDLRCGGICTWDFKVFVWPAGSTWGAEAFSPGALRYSYGLPVRLGVRRHLCLEL